MQADNAMVMIRRIGGCGLGWRAFHSVGMFDRDLRERLTKVEAQLELVYQQCCRLETRVSALSQRLAVPPQSVEEIRREIAEARSILARLEAALRPPEPPPEISGPPDPA